jgi:hypothetical protein
MASSMDVFLTESNVDIYLSRLDSTLEGEQRARLIQLLVYEESKMGFHREHVQKAEERVMNGRARVDDQRKRVAQLPTEGRKDSMEALMLKTLEQTQELLEQHLAGIQSRMKRL